MYFDNTVKQMIITCIKIYKVFIIKNANSLSFIKLTKIELDHNVSFISIISCLAKINLNLKGHCLIFLSAIYQLFIEYFNIK